MHVSTGTIVALYHGVFLYIFFTVNAASRMQKVTKVFAALPALLFVTLFPYYLESTPFIKFILTIIGFFSFFNIVDLVFLEPVDHMTFKEFMFYLSTASRANPNQTKMNSTPTFNSKGLLRLVKAFGKFLLLSVVFETVQKMEYQSSALSYYIFMYGIGLCLYLCFNILLDIVGLFWESVYNMKPKELFNAPFMASSPRDFWSKRWNMFFRDFFHKLFFKNVKLSYSRAIASALSIFVISGVLHEYVVWSIMGKFSGQNFLFFMIHGLATTVQGFFQMKFPILRRIPLALCIPINTVFLALTFPLFLGPYVQNGFVHDVKLPFSFMPSMNSTQLTSLYS